MTRQINVEIMGKGLHCLKNVLSFYRTTDYKKRKKKKKKKIFFKSINNFKKHTQERKREKQTEIYIYIKTEREPKDPYVLCVALQRWGIVREYG